MKKYTQEEINNILDLHKKWIQGDSNGVRADLSKADLSGADLSGANLFEADLSGTYLSKANLSEANLSGANLSGVNFYGADLSETNLSKANLYRTNLSGADLRCIKFNDVLLVIMHPIYNIQIKGKKWIKVSCQEHSYEKWLNFSEKEIKEMSDDALEFYPILIKHLKATFE